MAGLIGILGSKSSVAQNRIPSQSDTAQGVGMPAWGVAHSQGTQDFDSKAKERKEGRKLKKERVLAD